MMPFYIVYLNINKMFDVKGGPSISVTILNVFGIFCMMCGFMGFELLTANTT